MESRRYYAHDFKSAPVVLFRSDGIACIVEFERDRPGGPPGVHVLAECTDLESNGIRTAITRALGRRVGS